MVVRRKTQEQKKKDKVLKKNSSKLKMRFFFVLLFDFSLFKSSMFLLLFYVRMRLVGPLFQFLTHSKRKKTLNKHE